MNDTPAVHTQGLQKHFRQVEALKGIDLHVARGQVFGLLGPNGAGKTTLIRLMIGSLTPTAGSLTVLGLDPTRQKRALRSQIGYMPQFPALYDDLSPRENIAFFARAHQIENVPRRVDEVIDFVGLSGRARHPVHTFSGGMKQRVSLACALVHQPPLLFLDEPTSGIDPQLRETFWQHFRHLTAQGTTILVSTHQMDEAMYCDRLAILHQGDLLAADTPRQLLWNRPARVKIWRGEQPEQQQITNYPEQLPHILRQHGLDDTITRIEVEEDTLETVVLGMINAHNHSTPQEASDDRNP